MEMVKLAFSVVFTADGVIISEVITISHPTLGHPRRVSKELGCWLQGRGGGPVVVLSSEKLLVRTYSLT